MHHQVGQHLVELDLSDNGLNDSLGAQVRSRRLDKMISPTRRLEFAFVLNWTSWWPRVCFCVSLCVYARACQFQLLLELFGRSVHRPHDDSAYVSTLERLDMSHNKLGRLSCKVWIDAQLPLIYSLDEAEG